jgi:hypothetical protein
MVESKLGNSKTKIMLKDAWDAVNKVDGWEFLKTFSFESLRLFESPQKLNEIDDAMVCKDHSGFSYTFTMKHMIYIAKHGWDKYIH